MKHDKVYTAALTDSQGEYCGWVFIYAPDEASARGQLMSMGIHDYSDLEEME